jgi:hypothetical protein
MNFQKVTGDKVVGWKKFLHWHERVFTHEGHPLSSP